MTRSVTRSRATSVAAPATRTSSPPSAAPPRPMRNGSAVGRDGIGEEGEMAIDVLGVAGQAGRRPALHHRQRQLPRRHQAALDGPHGHPAQPLRPRQHPLDRHVRGGRDARRRRLSSSVPTSRTTRCRWPGRPAARRGSRTTSTRRGCWPRTASSGPAKAWPRSSPRRPNRPPTRSKRSRSTGSRCPAVVDAEKATQPGAPQLHENAPNNVVFEWQVGDKAGTDAAFDAAEVVVRQRIVNQRLIPNPMEVRGDIGWYNPGMDEYTIWMSSQTPAHPAAAACRLRDGHPGAQGPLHLARRRRGVRDQDLLLRRHGPQPVRLEAHRRPAGQVGRVAPRELPVDDPRSRPHHLPRGRRHP